MNTNKSYTEPPADKQPYNALMDFHSASQDSPLSDTPDQILTQGHPSSIVETNSVSPVTVLFKESFQVILPALILAMTVHLFLAQATIVYGQSMEPNLYEKERLIIDKVSYRLHPPQRNDIVVLDLPNMDEMLVKRIIGLPGETIEIRNGVVLVNNLELFEPFPHELGHQNMPPVVLGPLSYFVLGDNRENSNDSRAFGSVQREYILGRVWLRYWPLNQLKNF